MDDRFDLHSHSVYSDGSHTVDELVEEARAAGLAGIAVTDHDSLAQLEAVRARAKELGYPIAAGTEVSSACAAPGRNVHSRGLGIPATAHGSGPLERMVAPTLKARTANTLWQAWALQRLISSADDPTGALEAAGVADAGEADPAFSLDAVFEVSHASTGMYKQHIMEALTHRAYRDPLYQPIYRSIFKGSGVCVSDISYPEATDVVRAIREQGGIPVLAHPGQMDSWSIIPDLVQAGLQGIEVYHPDHDEAAERRAREAAEVHGLIMTGGSDYHGRYGGPAGLGVRSISAAEVGDVLIDLFA